MQKKRTNSVWQEGNFVRLFDLGVQGKLWRQLQAMYKNRTIKVRLPFGDTDWFKISKGVAQGAVVNQEEFDIGLDDYYAVRGWTKNGVPTAKKLQELGLEKYASLVKEKGEK